MRKITIEDNGPVRLSAWLKAKFPLLPGWAFKAALKNKDIRINGKRTGEDIEFHSGDEVVLYINDAKLDGPPLEVAWVSANIVVAVKQPGISSKAEDETDMENLVGDWLEKRGEPREAHACHRLDNRTGGLMIFARSASSEAAMRKLMEEGRIVKKYTCIVKGAPDPAHAVLTAYMKKDAAKAHVAIYDRPAPGARTAVTEYTALHTDGVRSLLEVRLHTGRTHQIRAQMAYIGHPVLGDDKYGDREFNRVFKARRQKLWASGLEFDFTQEEYPELSELAGKKMHSSPPFLKEMNKQR